MKDRVPCEIFPYTRAPEVSSCRAERRKLPSQLSACALSPLSALCLVAFVAYAYLGLYVLVLDARARVHRLFFAGSTAFALWALAYTVGHSADSAALYRAAYRFSSPFWIACAPIALHFFVALTRPGWLDRRPWLPMVLYAPAVVLLWRELASGLFAAEFVRTPLGWHEVPDLGSPWFWGLVAYYQLTSWALIALTWHWGATSQRPADRVSSRLILAGSLLSLLGVTLDNLGWPGLADGPLPSVAPAFPVFAFAAMAWSLVRYRFMANSPSAIAPVLLRTMDDTVLLLDERGLVLSGNESCRNLLGLEAGDLAGRDLASLLRGESAGDQAFIGALLEQPRGAQRELSCLGHDGRVVPVLLSVAPLARRRGAPQGAVVVLRDISAARLADARLRQMAQHDPLTGLTNRYVFQDRLAHALESARRTGQHVAVLVIDLDRFKQVNDAHGHAAGDLLLQEVAARLRAQVRKSDTASRMGGDEFALVLSEIEGPAALAAATARIRQACSGSVRFGAEELPIMASIGAAVFPDDADNAEALLRLADLSMYKAKRQAHGVTRGPAWALQP